MKRIGKNLNKLFHQQWMRAMSGGGGKFTILHPFFFEKKVSSTLFLSMNVKFTSTSKAMGCNSKQNREIYNVPKTHEILGERHKMGLSMLLPRFWSSIKHSKGWKCLSIHAELGTRYRANEERSEAYVYLHNLSSASGLTRKELHKSWEFVVYHKRMSKCFFSLSLSPPCFTP